MTADALIVFDARRGGRDPLRAASWSSAATRSGASCRSSSRSSRSPSAYVLLLAPFIAALQVIVYAGAILVLFLFVLMLLNVGRERPGREAAGRSRRSSAASASSSSPACCSATLRGSGSRIPRRPPAERPGAARRPRGPRAPALLGLPAPLRGGLGPAARGAGRRLRSGPAGDTRRDRHDPALRRPARLGSALLRSASPARSCGATRSRSSCRSS